jgi:hypothetical protein
MTGLERFSEAQLRAATAYAEALNRLDATEFVPMLAPDVRWISQSVYQDTVGAEDVAQKLHARSKALKKAGRARRVVADLGLDGQGRPSVIVYQATSLRDPIWRDEPRLTTSFEFDGEGRVKEILSATAAPSPLLAHPFRIFPGLDETGDEPLDPIPLNEVQIILFSPSWSPYGLQGFPEVEAASKLLGCLPPELMDDEDLDRINKFGFQAAPSYAVLHGEEVLFTHIGLCNSEWLVEKVQRACGA